jgi:rsbT co-antagonist protein RsbR
VNTIKSILPELIAKNHDPLLQQWMERRKASGGRAGQADEAEVAEIAKKFMQAFRQGADSGQFEDIMASSWTNLREVLEDFSRSRAVRGWSPSETATFVFSLKEPLFELLSRESGRDADKLARETWIATLLLDKLGMYTAEVFMKSREEVITSQQTELLELSTPVVRLWDGILAVPLIGTLDSARTQVVMESLLQAIVETGSEIAIIDITGVPTVDTLVAQHLLKTVSAARLMGADCLISGIRPQIAQTIVHLGVQLDVVSKATLADAFGLALKRVNKKVVSRDGSGETAKKPASSDTSAAE